MEDLINGKRPEQIQNALCICTNGGCTKYKCAYEEDGDCSGSVMRDALELIKQLEAERDAALAKVPRWISVKDELPPKHLRVLLMNGHRMVASGYLTYVKDKCGTSLWCMDGVRRNDVTHWAKLPEPPKEK